MSEPACALLARLLDATPLPPAAAGIDELLAAFAALHAARQGLLEELDARGAAAPGLTDADRAIARQIVARQDAWGEALAAARARLCEQRLGVGKLRLYAAVDAAALERG